jgi:DNA-binding CsgD family transcriptional regulator
VTTLAPHARESSEPDAVAQGSWFADGLDSRIAYLYVELGLSAAQCAERLHISASVVLRRLAANGVPRRRPGGSKPRLDYLTLQQTEFLYVELGLSLSSIARLYGVQRNTIRYRLRCLGVPLRSRGGANRTSAFELAAPSTNRRTA